MKIPNRNILNPDKFNDWIFNVIDDYSHRFEIYYGGAGSGKSYGAISKIILKAIANPRRILIIRKVEATIKHSIFNLTINILKEISAQTHISYNISNLHITLSNGSEFIFKGIDNPEKIKSINGITDIVIEEATEINLDDFIQLNLRLRPKENHPQIYLMFNPISRANWCYNYWFQNQNNDALIIHSTYKQNKFLTQDYIQTLENLINSNDVYYRIYCLGEFGTLDKLIFPNIHKKIIRNITHLPLFIGLDFGYVNDPSAIIWGYIDNVDKIIYIKGEFVSKGMRNDEIFKVIVDLGFKNEIIIADSSEIKSIDEIKYLGVRRIRGAVKGPGSIVRDISNILAYKIIVDSRLTHIITEFENYTWTRDKQTGEYVNIPIDSFNHCIDALRYGLEPHLITTGIKILK